MKKTIFALSCALALTACKNEEEKKDNAVTGAAATATTETTRPAPQETSIDLPELTQLSNLTATYSGITLTMAATAYCPENLNNCADVVQGRLRYYFCDRAEFSPLASIPTNNAEIRARSFNTPRNVDDITPELLLSNDQVARIAQTNGLDEVVFTLSDITPLETAGQPDPNYYEDRDCRAQFISPQFSR